MTNLPLLALRAMMTKKGWYAFGHLVKPESFGEIEYKRIFQHLVRLHDETEADVSIPALVADMEIQYRTKPDLLEEMKLVADYLDEAADLPQDMLQALITRFLQQTTAMEVAKYVAENASKPEFSVSALADLAARAVEIGERVDSVVVDLFAAPISGAPGTRPLRYSTGVSRQLDRSLRGGVGGGELLVFLGGPSSGKSSLLCRSGAEHARQGRNVLHITLEINSRKTIERYDQSWTSFSQDDFDTAHGQQTAQAARDFVNKTAGGHVWVIDWAYMSVSAGDIGAKIRQLAGQKCACHDLPMKVDVVVIDYLELMTPNRLPGREPRFAYKALAQEVRAMARTFDIPVLSAWQVNRVGMEKDMITQTDTSESWDIVKISDIIIGINRNLEEAQNRRGRLNIIKQREGSDRGLFPVYCDMDRMVIRDIEHADHVESVRALLARVPVSNVQEGQGVLGTRDGAPAGAAVEGQADVPGVLRAGGER